jgi:uncharacterized repeat protein (TIGR03803 family)
MHSPAPPRRRIVLAAAAAVLVAGAPAAAAAPAYKRLHAFGPEGRPEGFGPYGELVQGADGNLYGTTFYGGAATERCKCTIGGTVFRMTTGGAVTVLHTFFGADGLAPSGGLAIGPDGAFYGLTDGGGDQGGGTVFRIAADGTFTLLHSFDGPLGDGHEPYLGALALGPDGRFYGATSGGGAGGRGVLFALTTAGEVTVLHAFSGAPDGATPRGGLTLGSDGVLYGTTLCGGAAEAPGGCGGTLYAYSEAGGGYRVVHSFDAAAAEGSAPQAAPTEAGGDLYGTTARGGGADAGTVYRLPLGGGPLATLHAFGGGMTAAAANGDGLAPAGRLVLAGDGGLYGSTSNGGANQAVHPQGDGTLFRIGTDGSYALLVSFGASAGDGSHPMTGLAKGSDGTLYGVTETDPTNHAGTTYRYVPATR